MIHNKLQSAVSNTAVVTSDRRDSTGLLNQRWAFICLAIAWVIGTLVFEMTANGTETGGATKTRAVTEISALASASFLDRMERQHAISEAMTSDMDQLLRLAASEKLIAQCDSVIAQTQHHGQPKNAMVAQQSDRSEARSPSIIADSMMVDPILQVMPVSKWITQVAYQQLDRGDLPAGLRLVSEKRLALDQARSSAMPGLMRLLVSSTRSSITEPPAGTSSDQPEPAAQGKVASANQDTAESKIQPVSGSLSSVNVVSNAGGLASQLVPAIAEPMTASPAADPQPTIIRPVAQRLATKKPIVQGAKQEAAKQYAAKSPAIEEIQVGVIAANVEPLSPKVTTVDPAKAVVSPATLPVAPEITEMPTVASQPVSTQKPVVREPLVEKEPIVREPIVQPPVAAQSRIAMAPPARPETVARSRATVPAQPTPQKVAKTAPPRQIAPAAQPRSVVGKLAEPSVDGPTDANLERQGRTMASDEIKLAMPQPIATKSAAAQTSQPETSQLVGQLASPDGAQMPDDQLRIAQWPFKKSQPAHAEGANVTLNVQNTDVRSVLEMLARGYGMNILISPKVEGVVTANIDGLTPDQTLRSILKLCNLVGQVDGEAIFIYPAASMPDDARVVRHFVLDYARAEVVEPAVQGLLSPIGSAYVSKMEATDNLRTNESIVVVDTPESIARIAGYLMQADRIPRQVMIEAHVLEVELSDDMAHGVNLEALVSGDLTVQSFGLADTTASANNPLFWAKISGDRINSVIQALEVTVDAKTLATPKLMVVNGQSSRLQVGDRLGYSTGIQNNVSGNTIETFDFLETGVILSVTPTISHDDRVLMLVKPEVSSGEISPIGAPEASTRELETSVLLNNHQGVVIGGLIQENDRTVVRKLPWLGDVKHVGKLFQRRETLRARTEVIIALVPHIIELDEHPDQDCFDHEGWHTEYDRTKAPLLYGPLQRACRPWEPRLPDSAADHNHMDVNEVNRRLP